MNAFMNVLRFSKDTKLAMRLPRAYNFLVALLQKEKSITVKTELI